MQNLSFDDGYKEFSINGDTSKVIRFNPSDMSIIERIKTAYEEITKATTLDKDIELKADGTPIEELGKAADIVKGINDTIKNQIDYIFNSPISDMAFGKQSPLSMVGGQPLYAGFLNAIIPIVEKEVKAQQKASEARINKYTSQVHHK
jgi:hypothetical protein